ncbi:MAG: cytochrome c oxidase subunit 3 family protein [Acidobacteriota bacterium]|nr:cytochrome c oxidase subunit 3 family protein [Acidobacteriota bacterium]
MSSAHAGLFHHFDSYEQQRQSASLGMWLFIAQEIMFFGGLFTAYLVYRLSNPAIFAVASSELEIKWGGINTAVLILSSLTMALAVRMAQLGKAKKIVAFLVATLILGGTFVGIKYIEYSGKWEHHLVPGENFSFHLTEKEIGALEYAGYDLSDPKDYHHVQSRAELFFSIYFAMTGLHALHMLIGMGILIWLIKPAWRGKYDGNNHNFVEGFGLYWHFVDIVWIFLFPLLYLLGRHLPHA